MKREKTLYLPCLFVRRMPVKRTMVLLTLLAALAACVTTDGGGGDALSLDDAIAASAADIAGKLPPGTRVAIAAFESPHGNLSGYIMDEVTGALVDGSLEVADRNNLEYVYRELNYQMTGDVSDEEAVGIGRFLGARYVITGQLMDLGDRCRYRLNGINVETARHESSTRLDVRNDRAFQRMSAALQKAAPVVRTAGYGAAGAAPRTAGTFLDRGIMYAGRGEYDLAIADFSEAIRLDPDLSAAWMLRGRALFAGVSYITDIGDNFSNVGSVHTGGKVSDAKKAVYDRAIADFTQAITLDPKNKFILWERGVAYADKGDYDKAMADYGQAIRLDPEYAPAYNSRGNAYARKGDFDRAIADLDQAIRLDPAYAAAYSNRGNAYVNKGDNDRAIADFDQAIRLDPEDAVAYNNRGIAYFDKKDYDRAIANYSQAIRLDPEYAAAYGTRGIAYHTKGDIDKAIADYNQVIRLNPEDTIAYNYRGWAYYNKGDYDKAIADYNQVIRLDPAYVAAYINRGNAYASKADYRRARADWEQALRLDPNNAGARDNLERLRQMGY
jgi:tetratricopeptide (TPR) repeat protein